jgi:hypothetical protein
MDISFEGYESPSSITENRKNVKGLVIEMTAEPRQAWISAWEPAVKYSNARPSAGRAFHLKKKRSSGA